MKNDINPFLITPQQYNANPRCASVASCQFRIHPRRPPTGHYHTDTQTSVGTGSSNCYDLKNLANCDFALVRMADSGSKVSGSSAVATTIDRGKRNDGGTDASNERELGSTGGGGVEERVEVRSCSGRPCGDEEGVVATSTASSLSFSCQPSRCCCCCCCAYFLFSSYFQK